MPCMFKGCSYKKNIYGTFKSHKTRKHTPYTFEDFKLGIVNTAESLTSACTEDIPVDDGSSADCDNAEDTDLDSKSLSDVIEPGISFTETRKLLSCSKCCN